MLLKQLARLRFDHTCNQVISRQISRKVAGLSCSLLLISSTGLLNVASPAAAMSLGQKKPNLQLPLNEKLDEGTESGANTASGATSTSDLSASPAPAEANAAPAVDLTPMKLGDEDSVTPAESSDGSPTFKIRATEDNKLPNGTAENQGLPSTSVKAGPKAAKAKKDNGLGHTLYDTAKQTNLVPIALTAPEDETKAKSEFLETSEQRQIAALWDATLNRSPDIQFVVQKMVPTSDKGHAATMMARALSGVLAGSISAAGMLGPASQGTYAMQNMGQQLLAQVMGAVERRDQKQAQLGQAELISLYQLVRNTSDKLVDNYRLYKKNLVTLNRATTDFEELNNMMKAARGGQDAAKQLEMEYTVRKAQRDVIGISDDIHRYRQGLVDMAGNEAVSKLDTSVQEELQNLGEAVAENNKTSNPAIASPEPRDKDKPL